MNIHQKIFSALFALLAFFPLTFPSGVARAQQSAASVAAPRIDGFDVEQVKTLVAGTELDFTLYGTPGGLATVRIDGATGRFPLEEVEAGVYEGIYSIKTRDRIAAGAAVTANLRLGNQVASAILDESLVVGSRSRSELAADAAAASAVPKIDRFDVAPTNQLVAGNDLFFTLAGSPAGKASIRIAGVKGKFFLEEIKKGVYEGAYTIKNKDRIAADAAVTANLRLGNQDTSAILGKSLVAASAPGPRASRAAGVCPNCGTVEAINVIEVKGEGSYVGVIAGGIAGALLGSQVGQGRGTTAAQVIGAAGGAYAGNEAEKYIKRTRQYEVIVRLQGGGSQAVSYPAQPSFKVGDRVRVEAGALVLDQ